MAWFRAQTKVPETPPEAVVERLERLEDGIKRLERRFVKLQGEVSQAWRDRYDDSEEESDQYGE